MNRIRLADAVRLALFTGLGGFVISVVSGLLVYIGAGETSAIVARTVLVTALLVLGVRLCLGHRPASSLLPSALSGLLVGYLLNLAWLSGAVYFSRGFTQDLLICIVVDLVAWSAVGVTALRLVPAEAEQSTGYV